MFKTDKEKFISAALFAFVIYVTLIGLAAVI